MLGRFIIDAIAQHFFALFKQLPEIANESGLSLVQKDYVSAFANHQIKARVLGLHNE
jgi:hypothetical protein